MGFAGTKRKGAPLASPAVCAARPCNSSSGAPAAAMGGSSSGASAAMEDWRDWALLLPDLKEVIAARVLAADVVDYMSMRAVCTSWRASAPCPRDPTLRDARLRPRGWVALCDGDGVRPADACEVAFLQTATGRCVRARLPELRGYRIVGFTDGLLILLNKDTTAVRVLHPFTRVAVDLPPIAAIFNYMVKNQQSRAWMRAAVCMSQSSDSIAVVAWFPNSPGVVVSEPSFPCWYIINHNIQLAAAVSFQGSVYGVISNERQVVQVYPQCLKPCIARIPNTFGIPQTHLFFLVESATRLILVLRHFNFENSVAGYRPCEFALFEVDTADEHRRLNPLSSLGDQALFISRDRCLSVSHNNLHSITGNAIYFYSEDLYPIIMYSVSSGTCEMISTLSIIHNFKKKIRPSVRPFTLVDHLFTFCNHRHWSSGLMFHEYHCIPRSWKAIFKKLKAQDCEVQVKSLEGSRLTNNTSLSTLRASYNKNYHPSPSSLD